MAAAAFLVDAAHADVALGPAVAERLVALGVATLALYRDGETLLVVLEGWAFDPSSTAAAATAIGIQADARTLRPVMETALRASG